MPSLMDLGPGQMMERAKANGLVVPLEGYRVHVAGVAMGGLTPQTWFTVKQFWTLYFQAARAELVSYSSDYEVKR